MELRINEGTDIGSLIGASKVLFLELEDENNIFSTESQTPIYLFTGAFMERKYVSWLFNTSFK